MIILRKLLVITVLSAFSTAQELFDPYQVHTLDIVFYNSDYDEILQDRWEVDDKTYELATIVFNGDTLDSVGVRYKGNSTFWWTQALGSPKYPLNIDFNLVYDDQDLLGYNKVKLSNSIFDPTFVRETLGYLTQSYYLPASETGYMEVSINSEYLGLYVSVESINKSFLRQHFGNDEGTFFKCEPQFHYGEEYDAEPNLAWHGSDSMAYAYQMAYELKSDVGWADLLDLIYTLNFNLGSIETILNVDRVLWFFASSTVMPDLDAYTGFYVHNYYLYRNTSSNQFEIIPWDKDHTFGGAMINIILEFGGNVSLIYDWDPFLYENNDGRPLFSKLMSVPLYKEIYTAHMRTIIEEIYNVDYMQSLAYEMQDSIETYADAYPNIFPQFNTGDYFRYNVDNYLIAVDGSHWCGITSTVEARLGFLLNHAEISKVPPVISAVSQDNTDPQDGENVIIQAEVEGAGSVELMATTNPYNSRFISIPMYDDGAHGDGEANDNIFGALVPFQAGGSHVKYYIRAGNEEALVLSPQKAEREFYGYTIDAGSLTSPIVINEINYNSSDDFDTEDWMELVNTGDDTLDIGQWTFKDENDDHIFTIPGNTALAPDQYLVLCNDTAAFKALFPEVHNYTGDLGFGLDGGGELVRLFDANGLLMDAVEYDDDPPWPEEPDGNGPSLELIDPALDNSLAANWAASAGYGSPGSINSASLSNEDRAWMPQGFRVFDNYPNPFNPTTTISYELPENSFVTITIYDMLGREVRTLVHQEQGSGYHAVTWDAANDHGAPVSAGVYLYVIQVGKFRQAKKMILLK